MFTKKDLSHHRGAIEQLRQSLTWSPQQAQEIGQSIMSSWQRSISACIPNLSEFGPDIPGTVSPETLGIRSVGFVPLNTSPPISKVASTTASPQGSIQEMGLGE